jgi:hypothetical protein
MFTVEDTTPSAATLGVVNIAPRVSSLNKLDIIRSSGSNLLGVRDPQRND